MNDFHIKREVTWGHIVTTIMLVVSAIMAWGDLTSSMLLAEQDREYIKEKVKENKQETKEQLEKIDKNVEKILEQMIEQKGHKHRN